VPSLNGARAEHTAFSLIGFVAVPICAGLTLAPKTNPAVVKVGKERGSAEVAGQRADATSSWNTLKGGVQGSFRRLETERVADCI
jgi:hypothetical protein